jgi:WD40 repeat protein
MTYPINGDLRIAGNLRVDGTTNISSVSAVTTIMSGDDAINASHDDVAGLSGIAFSPVPDGSRGYIISGVLNGLGSGNADGTVRLWVGSNGGQADTTPKQITLVRVSGNENMIVIPPFYIVPGVSDVKYGYSFEMSGNTYTIHGSTGPPAESYMTVVSIG